MPRKAICAEIGVWKGGFSEQILSTTSPKRLHLIDPWEFQSEFSERMFGGSVAKSQQDMDNIYNAVKEKFKGFQNVVFNRGKSEKILHEFPDQYFDWVYVDGNHYYDYVIQDLQMCLRKVRRGGFITGDDYGWGESDGFPVKAAVQDFVNDNGLEGKLTVIGGQFIIET